MEFNFNDYKSYLNPLSEEFIERNKDLVDWYWISEFQTLSEEFIERNKDLVNWYWISEFQTLSEEFIERNKDLVNWEYISEFQTLSEEFIERNDFNEEDKIVIEVKGGLVTNIFSNFGLHFQVIVNDYDCVDCVRVDTKGLEKIW
jgi:hypothetical protein